MTFALKKMWQRSHGFRNSKLLFNFAIFVRDQSICIK